jgi:inner membrane protein
MALAPDLDLLASVLGAPETTPLAHRGITHSIPFALALSFIIGLAFRGRGRGRLSAILAFGALASHGLLDTMSQLGNGPRLLWPFTSHSYEFAWRPIPGVSSAPDYLTTQAIPTLVVETLMFLPLILFALVTFFPRHVDKEAAEDALS